MDTVRDRLPAQMLRQSGNDSEGRVMGINSLMQPATVGNKGVATNVRILIAEHLGADAKQVSDEAHLLDDLGADWLDRLELMIVMEDHFGIEFADDDIEKLATVGDLLRLIEANRQLESRKL
jgi:acyl carrier protein